MKEIEIFEKRVKQVLKDRLLDNIQLDEVYLDDLVEELLEMIGKYFLASVLSCDFIDIQDVTETILWKEFNQ